jgi:hypothetical protein
MPETTKAENFLCLGLMIHAVTPKDKEVSFYKNKENQFIDFQLFNHKEGKTTLFPSLSETTKAENSLCLCFRKQAVPYSTFRPMYARSRRLLAKGGRQAP